MKSWWWREMMKCRNGHSWADNDRDRGKRHGRRYAKCWQSASSNWPCVAGMTSAYFYLKTEWSRELLIEQGAKYIKKRVKPWKASHFDEADINREHMEILQRNEISESRSAWENVGSEKTPVHSRRLDILQLLRKRKSNNNNKTYIVLIYHFEIKSIK